MRGKKRRTRAPRKRGSGLQFTGVFTHTVLTSSVLQKFSTSTMIGIELKSRVLMWKKSVVQLIPDTNSSVVPTTWYQLRYFTESIATPTMPWQLMSRTNPVTHEIRPVSDHGRKPYPGTSTVFLFEVASATTTKLQMRVSSTFLLLPEAEIPTLLSPPSDEEEEEPEDQILRVLPGERVEDVLDTCV